MSLESSSNGYQKTIKDARSADSLIYEFESFRLDPGSLMLYRAGIELPLTPKQVETLLALVERGGAIVPKDDLMERLWPNAFVEESNLVQNIHILRKTLGKTADGRPMIETLHRRGYRFSAEPARIGGEDGVRPSVLQDSTRPGGPDRRRSWLVAGAASVLVGAVVVTAWFARVPFLPHDAPSANAASDRSRSPGYDLYVRGKVKVASENQPDTEVAIKLLEEAVALDPNLAQAYAQLARGYNTMAFKYSSGAETKRYHENAEVAIEKALSLDPGLAEAHFARGLILWSNVRGFPHEKAIQSYKRSLALDPTLDETYHQLSLVYSHIGLLTEARENVDKALEINPNNTLARFRAGVYVAYEGRFEDALETFKTIPRDFTPLLIDRSKAEALIQAGRADEAKNIADDYLARFPQDEGGSFTSVKALLLAKAGRNAEAETAIKHALEIGRGYGHFHHTTYNIASAYAVMNRPDEAVKWLQYTAENGFPNYPYFEIDPNLDTIRNDAHFTAFMADLKTRWQKYRSPM